MTAQENANKIQHELIINISKDLAQKLNPQLRKEMVDAYLKLFSAMAWKNWTEKKPLGQAWQNALTQCDDVLKSENAKNPAVEYMKIFANAYKKHQSKVIMLNKNSENLINKTDEKIQKIRENSDSQIKQSIAKIKALIAFHVKAIDKKNQIGKENTIKKSENDLQWGNAQNPQMNELKTAESTATNKPDKAQQLDNAKKMLQMMITKFLFNQKQTVNRG
ncbi:MAG: hypothetical protein IKW67_03840 [Alphaproteobacteria bacterium]|nr:hypothetical protein [Alphaproteobacteria bacterium]